MARSPDTRILSVSGFSRAGDTFPEGRSDKGRLTASSADGQAVKALLIGSVQERWDRGDLEKAVELAEREQGLNWGTMGSLTAAAC